MTNMENLIANTVWGVKGGIVGFQQGLLNDERIRLSDDCFNEQRVASDLFFMSSFAARERPMWEAVRFAEISSNLLLQEMETCNWTSTVRLLQEYCHSHDYLVSDDSEFHMLRSAADWDRDHKMRCTQPKMIENFYMRFFNF